MKLSTFAPYIFTITLVTISTFLLGGGINNLSSLHDKNTYEFLNQIEYLQKSVADNLKESSERFEVTSDRLMEINTKVDEMKVQKEARLYKLEVTICRFNDTKNTIDKENIIMNDIIAINPSISYDESHINTNIWNVLIHWFEVDDWIHYRDHMSDPYACDLKVLSIK